MSSSSSDNTESVNNDDSNDSIGGNCNTDLSGEHHELLPLDKAKSSIWEYFGFPAKNGDFTEKDKKKRTEVHCKLCPRRLNYLGNTTNMMVHLQYNH